MGKDRLLGIINSAWMTYYLLLPLLLYSVSGCISLPRIIILHDPLTKEEHLSLGIAYESQKKVDLALSEYEMALRKDPDYVIALINIGNIYYQKRDYKMAEQYYKEAIKRDVNNGGVYNNLSWVYISQNIKMDEAEMLVKRAIEIDPVNKAYYLDTLATIYIKRGRFGEALERLQEAKSLLIDNDEKLRKSIEDNMIEVYKRMGIEKD